VSDTVERALHSILAPSKGHMWAHCVGALRMCKGIPNKPTKDAASGTCTHWISEQELKGIAPLQSQLGKELQFDGFKFTVDQDRIDRARKYVDVIQREPGSKYYEHLVDTSPVLGVEGQEGHSDCISMDPDMVVTRPDGNQYKGILSSHDLKDGAGLVYAKDNMQGLVYVAAAAFEFDIVYPWEGFRFCVHQPRMHHYDEWFYTREEIAAFVATIRPVAQLAFDIYHDVVPLDEDAHLNPGYDTCRWCDVRGSCRKRAAAQVARFAAVDPTQRLKLTDEEVTTYYATLNEMEDWAKALRAEAFRRAAQRRGSIPGYKIVRGKAGSREWTDEKKAQSAILFALPPDAPDEMVFKPRELQSPTQIQKVLKKNYDLVKDLVYQPPGQLSIAPLHDRREEVILERAEFSVIDTSDFDSLI